MPQKGVFCFLQTGCLICQTGSKSCLVEAVKHLHFSGEGFRVLNVWSLPSAGSGCRYVQDFWQRLNSFSRIKALEFQTNRQAVDDARWKRPAASNR